MKKILICLFLTAFCCVNAYSEGGGEPFPLPAPPTKPNLQESPSVAPFSLPLNNTAPQITYTKGYISVYTASYKNIIVRVQAVNGTVLYESAMAQSTLVIDARNWNPDTYDVVVLTK